MTGRLPYRPFGERSRTRLTSRGSIHTGGSGGDRSRLAFPDYWTLSSPCATAIAASASRAGTPARPAPGDGRAGSSVGIDSGGLGSRAPLLPLPGDVLGIIEAHVHLPTDPVFRDDPGDDQSGDFVGVEPRHPAGGHDRHKT